MRQITHDFRDFAIKGNAIDMAVGILLGVAFNKIVQSLVNDIFMPPLGLVIGGVEFKDLKIILKHADTLPDATPVPEVAIRYGMLVNACAEFFIIALAAFITVRVMANIIRKRDTTEEPAPGT